jgi:transcriptional regulator with XRE-family HTH domain
MALTLSERIRDRLNELEMTAAELARQVGIKPPSVFLWLDGTTKSIKGQNLLRAAAALKVTPDWLATGKGPKLLDASSTPQTVKETRSYYGDPLIGEAIELLEKMQPRERADAVSFLKVFAAKKGGTGGHGQGAHLPAAARAA